METNEQLKQQVGDLWPVDEPLDFRDNPTAQGYYHNDLDKVAGAHADWIDRVRRNYPELLATIPGNQPIEIKKSKR